MSVDKVREYLRSYGLEDRIKEFGLPFKNAKKD